ncbi:MAG TPA: ABC transporter permease [Bryobacteraceae bacterium]|jgi:putative ABC transport system permease protein|nr:ABC transporter permease [Bryobacteraceae bacterium]
MIDWRASVPFALRQDMVFAVRQLRKNTAFTFAAVFALALGIGANTAIFSTINAVLLNSQPFQSMVQPGRIMSIYERNPALFAFIAERLPVRLRNYREWKKQNRSFVDMAAYQDTSFDLTSASLAGGNREPEHIQGASATANFFPLIGVRPRIGRNFTPDEMQTGNSRVTIISDELWRSRFQSDPNILGKTITATGTDYQIVGVLPPGFELPAEGQGLDQSKPKMWVPLHINPGPDEENRMALLVFGRLRPGVTIAQARAEMNVIGDRLRKAYPDMNTGFGINVFPTLMEDVDPDTRRSLYILQAAVGFVLLIACANVANLLLTKAVAREREMAVRVALGASRWRIVRQNLAESLMLSLIGGAAGLLIATGALRLVSYLAPVEQHGFHELRINPLVLAFTLGTALLAGILFGLAPSFHALGQSINQALNRGARSVGGSSNRFRSALVVVEISLSLVLLAGAGLTLRSLASIMSLDLGFRPDHLLTMSIALPGSRYKTPEQIESFNSRLLEGVQHLPGVRSASLSTALPMRSISESSYRLPGVAVNPQRPTVTDWSRITEGYLRTIGLRLVRGRDLTREDVLAAEPNVALVNSAFARANWPKQDALGKVVIFGGLHGHEVNFTVVGVVSDEHQFGPDDAPHTQIYLPSNQMQTMSLAVQTVSDPLALANSVKRQVWAIDKDEPVSQVDSMDDIFSEWIAPRRFNMTVLINFAAIALILAAVGLYSVLAYSVTLRTREIGIRVALGAEPKNVAGFVMRQGAGLAVIGIVIGLGGAFALTRFMQSILFGVSPSDPATLVGVCALLLGIALAASYFPARRASQIEPMQALRIE